MHAVAQFDPEVSSERPDHVEGSAGREWRGLVSPAIWQLVPPMLHEGTRKPTSSRNDVGRVIGREEIAAPFGRAVRHRQATLWLDPDQSQHLGEVILETLEAHDKIKPAMGLAAEVVIWIRSPVRALEVRREVRPASNGTDTTLHRSG